MQQWQFTIPEILSLLGVAQCVYVLVYMMFRAGDFRRALVPFAYFFVLAAAFFLDFAARNLAGITAYYGIMVWWAWFMGPPLGALLIVQVARVSRMPGLSHFGVLFMMPLAYGGAIFMATQDNDCVFPGNCPALQEWLVIAGLMAGGISMLSIWGQRRQLDEMYRDKSGKDRYWLILTLVIVNILFLGLMLASLSPALPPADVVLARTFMGLALVYLAGTSLFRIYPQSVSVIARDGAGAMSAEEKAAAERIQHLLDYEKIYQEPSYGRAELARELELSETVVSRVVNLHFGKSFPQLLNERRVEDAKRLLRETTASVKVIAGDVGFNSAATFNRVFRDITGVTPSAYRQQAGTGNAV